MSTVTADLAERFAAEQNVLYLKIKKLSTRKTYLMHYSQFYKRSVRKEYEQHWDEEVNEKF